ncbi:MAG: AsmA family protein, partial [Rhizobiales bacterium]|nr:AsmA family protein [Hyphomicrobiales bacterium]
MKLWKSPVLYIGILLLAAVIGALAAPVVVDWNSYRPRLEAYGEELTGRKVTINGALAVRLFPWPSLTADDVRIANPPELGSGEFARADRVQVLLQLAGLFSGTIQVESITVDQPVVALMRPATGKGNWVLHPSATVGGNDLLRRVKLDQITLTGAEVSFADARGGMVRL